MVYKNSQHRRAFSRCQPLTRRVNRIDLLCYLPAVSLNLNSTLGTILTSDLYQFSCLYLHRISRMPKRAHIPSNAIAYCFVSFYFSVKVMNHE